MSSSKKTANLKLNQWLGTDIPERVDFVSDNDLIDKAVSNHTKNSTIHISSDERDKWNSFYYKFSYTGDGTSSRTVESGCPFIPTWGIVIANTYPPSVIDAVNNSNYNYFAVFTNSGSNSGVNLVNGNNLKVIQSSTAVQKTEYRNYNQSNVVYVAILFR